MPLNLKKPLAVLDLETTGTNITHDRIIEIAVIKMMPHGTQYTFSKILNPQKSIPIEASQIHGIYDKDVQDAPTFQQISNELLNFLEECDLAGFNILHFDIPMLAENFLQLGMDFDIAHRKIVDVQKIFHQMEKRNLAAAYQFYCQKELSDAHRAMADTKATLAVLEAQIARYEHQPMTDRRGRVIGAIENDIANLHQLTTPTRLDFAGRLGYDANNRAIFNFGKHKGKPIVQVLQQEPSYYDWMMKGDFPLDTKKKLTQIKLQTTTNSSP